MPLRFRADIETIEPYRPGRSIEDVAAAYGLGDVVKLASNESPEPPFPEVQAAIAAATGSLNRYPDNRKPRMTAALAEFHGVPPERIWCGGASNELTLMASLAMGGPGTSAVHAWPSFGLYRIGSRAAFAADLAVRLDAAHRHDLGAMQSAVRVDTTIVFVCNPNNPTGTHVPGDALEAFIDALPEDVLIVVDEAYAEYVTAGDYRTMLPLAAQRPNVMVTRTFSKVYGLAGLRIGYAITAPETIANFRRIQLPFSVNSLGEVAAVEALRHQDRVAERAKRNSEAIAYLTDQLRTRGYEVADSQTNFVYVGFGDEADAAVDHLHRAGIIVRPVLPPGYLRITAGTPEENERLVAALDALG
jgi:histidinol-phosphate aminotransferase